MTSSFMVGEFRRIKYLGKARGSILSPTPHPNPRNNAQSPAPRSSCPIAARYVGQALQAFPDLFGCLWIEQILHKIRGRYYLARRAPAPRMSSFRIFIIACIAFGCLTSSDIRAGVICHESPNLSFNHPHWLSAPPAESFVQ